MNYTNDWEHLGLGLDPNPNSKISIEGIEDAWGVAVVSSSRRFSPPDWI